MYVARGQRSLLQKLMSWFIIQLPNTEKAIQNLNNQAETFIA